MLPQRRFPCGPVTARRIARLWLIYLCLFSLGFALAELAASPHWQAFGLGLMVPGGGFLAHVDGSSWQAAAHVAVFVSALLLFIAALLLWFATGNVLAPPLVWLVSAIAAGFDGSWRCPVRCNLGGIADRRWCGHRCADAGLRQVGACGGAPAGGQRLSKGDGRGDPRRLSRRRRKRQGVHLAGAKADAPAARSRIAAGRQLRRLRMARSVPDRGGSLSTQFHRLRVGDGEGDAPAGARRLSQRRAAPADRQADRPSHLALLGDREFVGQPENRSEPGRAREHHVHGLLRGPDRHVSCRLRPPRLRSAGKLRASASVGTNLRLRLRLADRGAGARARAIGLPSDRLRA